MFVTVSAHRATSFLVTAAISLSLAACGGGGGGSSTAPTNNAPTANAGPDQSTVEKATITMAGSGNDSDGGTLSYAWSQVSGPAVTFAAATDPASNVEMPFIPVGTTEDIVLRLTVGDGQGGSASDDVTISTASNDYVVFRADKDTDNLTELYLYDTQLDEVRKLNGPLVTGGFIFDYKISPDGQYVAYRADQDANGVTELFAALADGSGVTRVNAPMANAGGDVSEYQWSPDGTQIVYTADADVDGAPEVFLVDADGGNPTKINGGIGAGPSVYLRGVQWSPDGRYIAQGVIDFVTNRPLGINTYDSEAGQPNSTRVVTMPGTGAIVPNYVWSPDATMITYLADQDTDNVTELYSGAADGSGTTKLNAALVAGGAVVDFQWAPDGTRVAYFADQDTDELFEVYSVQADGMANVTISGNLSAGQVVGTYEWAPDSSRIAYSVAGAPPNELFTTLPDGSGLATVNGPLVTNGAVGLFLWSPDGARIAYQATQDTVPVIEIYASNADGTGNEKVSDPLVTNGRTFFTTTTYPLWSPDSSMFSYASDSVTAGTIENWVHDFSGGADPQITRSPVSGGGLQTWAVFSADSSALIYRSVQDAVGVSELYLASPDGMTNRSISGALVAGGSVQFGEITWSP